MAAITLAEIQKRGSTTSGSAGNSVAFGGANTSLGKYIANAILASNILNSLFTDATGAENAASENHYACLFYYNSNPSNALINPVVWISGDPAGGAAVAIGIDTVAASALGSASPQALQIADKKTAPAGVSFSSPASVGAGLALGDIPAGFVKAIWIRRALVNSAAMSNDGITLSYRGDTAAA